VATASDTDKLREFLNAKIAKRKKQIHREHSARFNHDMQLQIDCIEWVFEKIEVNKIPKLFYRYIQNTQVSS
jgi:predicted GTPase